MVDYPLVRFVASPDLSAAVRFDFNDGDSYVGADGFDLGTPSFEGDPDAFGVEYGPRELSFTLHIGDDKPAALAKQSALAREMLRRENWLLFQLDEFSAPVWFKTYRSQPGAMSLERVYSDAVGEDLWEIRVPLVADAFAYGERVTLPTTEVEHDPTVPDGMRVELPEILGDAPAPLRVEMFPPSDVEHFMVGTHAGDFLFDPSPDLDTWTGADTTAGTDSSAIDGTTYTTTFATTPTLARRVSLLNVPGGRFVAFVRVKASLANTTVTLRPESADTSGTFWLADATQVTLNTNWTWVRLGTISTPNSAPYNSAEDHIFSDPETSAVDIHAARISGGALTFDHLLLVPVAGRGVLDVRHLQVETASHTSIPTPLILIDGDVETVNVATYSNGWYHKAKASVGTTRASRGGFPRVIPGETNTFIVVRQLSGSQHQNVKTNSTTVTLSYHPRYLWLGVS